MLIVVFLGAGGFLGTLVLDGNVHEVEPGRLYRSGQLDSGQFVNVIRADGIRSILNLRGPSPGVRWYDAERRVSRGLGVAHYDYGISAEQSVTGAQIADILALIRAAPKPLLIHCKSGADRTGLVSALYEAVIEGKPAWQARDQLSLRYGHFPWLGSRTIAMDQSYWTYVRARSNSAASTVSHQ